MTVDGQRKTSDVQVAALIEDHGCQGRPADPADGVGHDLEIINEGGQLELEGSCGFGPEAGGIRGPEARQVEAFLHSGGIAGLVIELTAPAGFWGMGISDKGRQHLLIQPEGGFLRDDLGVVPGFAGHESGGAHPIADHRLMGVLGFRRQAYVRRLTRDDDIDIDKTPVARLVLCIDPQFEELPFGGQRERTGEDAVLESEIRSTACVVSIVSPVGDAVGGIASGRHRQFNLGQGHAVVVDNGC